MRGHAVGTTAIVAVTLALVAPLQATAAVGCTLNEPDRDIMRIFPDATSYVTDFIAISERGGDSLAARIEAQLGDELSGKFEALDVPYAYYTVLGDGEVIGRIHGVNQKGMFGGMQLILATDPDGAILDFYYQKLASPEAGKFRADAFTEQFIGLTLGDFVADRDAEDEHDNANSGRVDTGSARPAPDSVAGIEDPSAESAEDFEATLRGLRKNLILLHELVLRPAVEAGKKEEAAIEED
jgi:hypothetical protein